MNNHEHPMMRPTRDQLRAVDREHARIIKNETHDKFLALYRASLKEN